jgi:hypothetical protein
MKLHLFIINLLFFVSQNLFAQDKTNHEVEIVFNIKSTKLSKVEKEKIKNFLEGLQEDSNKVYCIELINEGCFKKKYLSWNRVTKIIQFINEHKKINTSIYFNAISKKNIDSILLSYIEKENAPTHGPPPFPNLKK